MNSMTGVEDAPGAAMTVSRDGTRALTTALTENTAHLDSRSLPPLDPAIIGFWIDRRERLVMTVLTISLQLPAEKLRSIAS